jgi:hypothetical protein
MLALGISGCRFLAMFLPDVILPLLGAAFLREI